MSHFLTVPINENGIITDANIDQEIGKLAVAPFSFTDVFIYSHGWWTSATAAMSDYNDFSVGFARTLNELIGSTPGAIPNINANFSALNIGIHWPSMVSEDQRSVANFAEATSFFTMEHRADDVGEHGGYSLLRLILEARKDQPPLRFHFLGHSFGCRVVLSALQTLSEDLDLLALAQRHSFDVALLEAAADCDSLSQGQLYADVLGKIPKIRMLITKSGRDTALTGWYPKAQKLAHLFSDPIDALGAVGPRGELAFTVDQNLTIGNQSAPDPSGRFVVADLTPLHQYRVDHGLFESSSFTGQHSDIFLEEIYHLLALFLG